MNRREAVRVLGSMGAAGLVANVLPDQAAAQDATRYSVLGSGPTVLVSHPGARQRDVRAAAERLAMIGRPPVWAVLAHRRLRGRVSGRVG